MKRRTFFGRVLAAIDVAVGLPLVGRSVDIPPNPEVGSVTVTELEYLNGLTHGLSQSLFPIRPFDVVPIGDQVTIYVKAMGISGLRPGLTDVLIDKFGTPFKVIGIHDYHYSRRSNDDYVVIRLLNPGHRRIGCAFCLRRSFIGKGTLA